MIDDTHVGSKPAIDGRFSLRDGGKTVPSRLSLDCRGFGLCGAQFNGWHQCEHFECTVLVRGCDASVSRGQAPALAIGLFPWTRRPSRSLI